MKTSRGIKALLAASGIILIGIGGALLFTPVAFHASSGISLDDNINLLSETRAPGGLLFIAGMLVAAGALKESMARFSMVLSTLIYLSYGASRVLSMAIDGMPHASLVAATGIEIGIGALSALVLLKASNRHSEV